MTVTAEQATAFGKEQMATRIPPNGVVVIYMSTCSHCKHSLENTNFATQTTNGTTVRWIDVATPEGMAAFSAMSGVTQTSSGFVVGGKALTGVPATLAIQGGVATDILKNTVLEKGDLDMFAAMLQSRSSSIATGSTVPYNAAPVQAVGQSRH